MPTTIAVAPAPICTTRLMVGSNATIVLQAVVIVPAIPLASIVQFVIVLDGLDSCTPSKAVTNALLPCGQGMIAVVSVVVSVGLSFSQT